MFSTEFFITSLVVILIPGTGVIYTVSIGLFHGSKASIFAALGCTLGITPSLLASILGLSAIMHTSAVFFQIVKFIGVIYLLYLAWSMFKNSTTLKLQEQHYKANMLLISLRGCLINILNPKLSLFFLAFLPQFISTNVQNPIFNMLVLGSIFMLMTLFVFILYGLLAHTSRVYIFQSSRIMTYIQRAFAVSFVALSAELAVSEN